ncbi:RHS repeat protein [Methylomonas sp. EFPC1]|uniref:RHS repeat protein n=1 Tax=Methylomonas sp. EFPC1 TaxID=2812647 RepID=UPI001966E51D|nr:RHS repeat protein [Methylomonas sp. EFPC1]QSB02663.1 RHS repeat protein [Methylomonas sp. EFPC1]
MPSANGEGLELSLHYASDNANGENASLETGLGFGWSHSYNIFLFTQNRDFFKVSPGGVVTKYQRIGRAGAITAIAGTQQTVLENSDGSIEITNRQGGTTYRFEKIPGNPLRVAAIEPWMLKSIFDRNGNSTQLSYQNGLLARVTDTYGRQIKFEYDASKHLSKITDPLNRVTQLRYGGYNNLTQIIDPLGNTVDYSYDVRHQIVGKTDKSGNKFRYNFNSAGHLLAVVDQLGHPLLTLANPTDWATEASALTLLKLRKYLPSVTTQTDGNGKQWQYFYNVDGQITKKVAPDNATQTYTYDPATLNMTSMTDANGHTTQYQYDSFGNLTTQIDANGNQTRYEYNNPFNLVTKMAYFANGASTAHSVTNYAYDTAGNRIQEIRDVGGLNLLSEWTYDTNGHVLTHKDPNGHVTAYSYDVHGNQSTVTDAENHVTTYEYDALGNKIKKIDGNGHQWTYSYDTLNRLTQETDPLGFVTLFAYDGVGNRLEVRKQVIKAPATFQTSQYQYDLRNRLIKESRDPAGLNLVTAYAYDHNDNRVQLTDPRGKVTKYTYDEQNRLTQVQDALTHIAETLYDSVGNRICSIDANQHYTFFNYDALNRLTKESKKIGTQECKTGDADDIITQHFYDTGANLALALCNNSQCGAPTPGSGNIVHSIDPEGKHSYLKYDHLDRRVLTLRKVTDTADGKDANDWAQIVRYDGVGNVLASTDANGNATTFSYLDNNWRHTEANALNETTTYSYDGVGNVKTTTSPGGNVTANSYNNRNELIQVSDTEGPVAGSNAVSKPGYVYDGIGNRIEACDGNDHCSQYAYDAANRLIAVTDALGETTHHSYDPAGNLTKSLDREAHATCYVYDDLNRRVRNIQKVGDADCSVLDGDDVWSQTAYDAVGNVTALTTAKQQDGGTPPACNSLSPPEDCETTRYVFDAVNRLVQEAYPLRQAGDTRKNTREYSYDKASNLKKRIDHKNLATDYIYNDLYYLTLRDYQVDADDSFVHDTGGRLLTATRDGWVVTFDYDAANRVLQSTQDGKAVDYAYDIPNRRRTLTYPGGQVVTEDRDFRERLADIDAGAIASYQYDFGNRVLNRSYGNSTAANYAYNENNWITSLSHTKADSSLIAGFGYDYDKEGSKRFEAKQHDNANSEGFQYDDLYRLIHYKVGLLDTAGTVQLPLTQTQYQLDKLGNWDEKIKDGVTEIRSHNAVNELTQINTAPLSYDDNGNLSHDSNYSYSYNQENRLAKVTFIGAGGLQTAGAYRYDALGRRIAKTAGSKEVRYFYDGARNIEYQSPTGATEATFVYGNYVDEVVVYQTSVNGTTSRYYPHYNYLYSVAALTDTAGQIVERYKYDPYGKQTISSGLGSAVRAKSEVGWDRGFTGYVADSESGLDYARNRMYSPGLGRFIERDPYLFTTKRPTAHDGYVDGMSLYAAYFVPGYLDPAGTLRCCSEWKPYWETVPFESLMACIKSKIDPTYWGWVDVVEQKGGIAGLYSSLGQPLIADPNFGSSHETALDIGIGLGADLLDDKKLGSAALYYGTVAKAAKMLAFATALRLAHIDCMWNTCVKDVPPISVTQNYPYWYCPWKTWQHTSLMCPPGSLPY